MKTTNKNFLYRLSTIRNNAFLFLEQELKKVGIDDIPASYGDIIHIIFKLEKAYVQDIVKLSYKDKSTVSNIINQLEKKGYVKKETDPEDGRKVMVSLTQKAFLYTEAAPEISKKLKDKLFWGMSAEEQEILFLLLNKVDKNIKI